MTTRRILLAVAVLAVVGVAAYLLFRDANTETAQSVDVTGVVVDAAGRPVPAVRIDFWPAVASASEWPHETVPHGLTGKDGSFAMRMIDPLSPGIPPGKYKVSIRPVGPRTGSPAVPKEYEITQTSQLEVVISDEKPSQQVRVQLRH